MKVAVNSISTHLLSENNGSFFEKNKIYKEQIFRAVSVCVMDSIYSKLFNCLLVINKEQDEELIQVIKEINTSGGLSAEIIGLKSEYYCENYLDDVISEFKKINSCSSTLAKYDCIKHTYNQLTAAVSKMIIERRKAYYGDDCIFIIILDKIDKQFVLASDDIIPLFVLLIFKAGIPHLITNLYYLKYYDICNLETNGYEYIYNIKQLLLFYYLCVCKIFIFIKKQRIQYYKKILLEEFKSPEYSQQKIIVHPHITKEIDDQDNMYIIYLYIDKLIYQFLY